MSEQKLERLAVAARDVREAKEARDRAIAKAAADGNLSHRQIARATGLSHTQIRAIVNKGRTE